MSPNTEVPWNFYNFFYLEGIEGLLCAVPPVMAGHPDVAPLLSVGQRCWPGGHEPPKAQSPSSKPDTETRSAGEERLGAEPW